MNGTNTRQGRCTDELYHPLFVWTLCVCETADSVHKLCEEIKRVYMWFCACLPVWMTEQSAVASTGEIYTLLLTCNLPPPAFLPLPRHHHLTLSPRTPLLSSETKAERLAPSWWLHPGPVDSNPPGVFQDVRHEAPQTHLLRPLRLRRWISEDTELQIRSFYWRDIRGKVQFVTGLFSWKWKEDVWQHNQRLCGAIGAFFVLLGDCFLLRKCVWGVGGSIPKVSLLRL